MLTIDFDHAIREVLASSGQVRFKHHYRLDVVNYSWVKDYVRDKKTREEIGELGKKIAEAQKSLIDKDELQAMFLAGVEQTRKNFLELLKINLARAQSHESGVTIAFHEYGVISTELPLMALSLISSEELADAIASLPEGVKREKVGKDVEAFRDKIAKLNEIIENELSPPDRWIHNDMGNPFPYPAGCRWSKFVDGWKKVLARFDGKVDIEGVALKTDAEFEAFYLLELENIPKLTPLRKPWE